MKNKKMTRRQRIANRRRYRKPEGIARDLLPKFESQMFMMHSVYREYRDSDAAAKLVQMGKAAMRPVAAWLHRICARWLAGGRTFEEYSSQFIQWALLVNDMLRGVGRYSPYSSQTPYGNQRMESYIQACLDCVDGKPQAAQIHAPDYVPAAVPLESAA